MWRDYFYFVVFSACSKCLRCSKIHHCAWKFTIPIVVIIRRSRCETLKTGTFPQSFPLTLPSLPLSLYSNLIGLKCSFPEIKPRDLGILMNGSMRCGSLKSETDAALLQLFPFPGYFYFFLSQESGTSGWFFFANHLLPTLNTKVLCSGLKVYNDSVWTKLQGQKRTWTNYSLHLIVDPIEFFLITHKYTKRDIQKHADTEHDSLGLQNDKNIIWPKCQPPTSLQGFQCVIHTFCLYETLPVLVLLISSFLSLSLP